MEKEISDKEWELIQILRNFRKMYPKSVEFELYINHIVTELMYGEAENED
jgi:sulfur relay (sulfurtransferase) DsrC/TusE family protein